MFMLARNADGVIVARQIKAPLNARSLRGKQLRSRPLWMEKMNVEATKLGARFYAFRYRGEWHLCEATRHHDPIRSIKDTQGANDIAKMWLIMREARDAE